MLNQNEERLQKALARAGIASRRASEDLIAAGRVKVNGKVVTQLGTKIDLTKDRVTVDDEPIAVRKSAEPQKIYLMLNKPAGYLSTVSDPQGRPTIMDLVELDGNERLYPVGRLDADSEGLLLLTNDGNFAHLLSHPRYGVEKEYVALMEGIVAMKDLEALRHGVPIRVENPETGEHELHKTRPAQVTLIRHEGSDSLVRFILKEGKKRQIRLMAEVIRHPVISLKRVRLGPLKMSDLPSGQYRTLSQAEVRALENAAQRPVQTGEPHRQVRQPERRNSPAAATSEAGPGRTRAPRRDQGPGQERQGRSRSSQPARSGSRRPAQAERGGPARSGRRG